MSLPKLFLFFFPLYFPFFLAGQVLIHGKVTNEKGEALPFVNIGIKGKNVGTCASVDGLFSVNIPPQLVKDTLTVALLGYEDFKLPVIDAAPNVQKLITLKAKPVYLKEIAVTANKPIEKKIGITRYKPVFHIVDASIQQDDIFEIAQIIHLPSSPSRVTSVNLFINESRKDSGIFRINFYNIMDGKPGQKLNFKPLLFKKDVTEGWLNFNLKDRNVYLEGDVAIGLEFIPNGAGSIKYEVKLGGATSSFVRTSSFGDWQVPPHHYRLYATALVDKNKYSSTKSDEEENEAVPTTVLFSATVKDSFYIFVSLPKDYLSKEKIHYPVVYLLDANVYFDFLKGNTENIIVGVGYKNALVADSLRERDYTYPAGYKNDSLRLSGGGLNFLKFIESELIPYMDTNYRTDSSARTLMGHSLGGYFTLLALSQQWSHPGKFKCFVAASPSLDYAQNFLLEKFRSLGEKPAAPVNLVLTIGQEESQKDFGELARTLKNRAIKLKTIDYPKMGHMETAVITFKTFLSAKDTKN